MSSAQSRLSSADPFQADDGAVGPGAPADGVGNVCQCGDVDGDGEVLAADEIDLRLELAGAGLVAFPEKCDVSGDAACDIVDVARIVRGVAGLGGVEQLCDPAVP